MKSTTAIIIVAAIVGGVVIWKLASPSSSPYRVASNTDNIGTAGLISGIASVFGKIVSTQSTSTRPTGVTYNVTPAAGGGEYIIPTSSNERAGSTGTGGVGIAGLDYPI